MFKTFNDDLTYLPKRKFAVKYTLPFIVAVGCLVVICQLTSLFVPLRQLNKSSGKIADMQIKVDYWTHQRGALSSHYYPVYSLFITLDNMRTFNIENEEYMKKLQVALRKGDSITVYSPSLTYKLISLGFAHKVNQVEFDGRVLYSYDEQRKDEWFLISMFSIFTGMFYILLRGLKKYAI
jgi:hypothetical protein